MLGPCSSNVKVASLFIATPELAFSRRPTDPKMNRLLRTFARHSSTQTQTQTQRRFREAMSSVASQVMILTAPASQTPQPVFKGVTLSSVSSLSINPEPLLQFNLMKPSLTATYLHAYEKFALHVLIPSRYSCDLARLFARNRHFDEASQEWVPFEPFRHLKEGEEYEMYGGVEGCSLPILTQVERVMICSKVKTVNVQDHEIWIAKVEEVIERHEGEKTGGLLNFNRKFHVVGEDLHKSTKT